MTDDEPKHLWHTLGVRMSEPGTVIWTATPDYCFPSKGGPVLQGGMVTMLLDAAMACVCWPVLGDDEAFVTADLRVEFLRATRPGALHATGAIVRRTRRLIFCSADLYDGSGQVTATSRGTQAVIQGDGPSTRQAPPGVLG